MPKPMDRLSQLQGLTARFGAAAAERDWLALAHLDSELAARLRCWTDTSAWTTGERQALQQLRQIHAETRGLVDAELGQAALLLRQLTDNQGCWTAYAASADWEERT